MAEILDDGYVHLADSMADDLSVVNSARVSLDKHTTEVYAADEKLIWFLMSNHHGTPFEHNAFRFAVKAPIFVAREWMRHRIGSFNEMSGRYTELKGEFYHPLPEDVRRQIGKPGAYTFEQATPEEAERYLAGLDLGYRQSWLIYQGFLQDGVAKELARLVLPVGIYTKFYWTVNARSLMNFLALRNAPQAMLEIRRYAEAIEVIFAEKMPITYAAFVAAGRVAP